VTSKECKNVSVKDAPSYILGYTVGNDLSCRFFQIQKNGAGQFYYAKAFDKFAPIGPVLISAERYEATNKGRRLITRVNGTVHQDIEIAADQIFSPAKILSHMSQGTPTPVPPS
jgi:2-keto-4-pentenoate hydratase/2-oxohepta-3-ene-1,7-dioic acid hydratase in catechol pathway